MVEDLANDIARFLNIFVTRDVTLLVVNLLQAVDVTHRNGEFHILAAADLVIKRHLKAYIGVLVLNPREGILVCHVDGGADGSLELHLTSLGLIDILQGHDDVLGILLRADDDKVYILRPAVQQESVIQEHLADGREPS